MILAGLKKAFNATSRSEQFPWVWLSRPARCQCPALCRSLGGQAVLPTKKPDDRGSRSEKRSAGMPSTWLNGLATVRRWQDVAGIGRMPNASTPQAFWRHGVSAALPAVVRGHQRRDRRERLSPAKAKRAWYGMSNLVKTLATLSDSTTVEGPKPLRSALKRLARLNRSLSRKTRARATGQKTKLRVARCHARIANVRQDALHKLTTHLAAGVWVRRH